MNLSDRISENPLAFAASIAVWIPIAVWIISLIHWMIQGEVDGLLGFIGIVIGVGLGVLTVNPPNPDLAPVVFLAIVATMAFFVPLRNAMNSRALVALDMSLIERAYLQLEHKPNDFGARMRIAKMIYQRGLFGHAITIAEEALKHMPEEFFLEEHKMVQRWKGSEYAPSQFRALPCVECGMGNPPGSFHCSRCGSRFLLDQAKGKWVGRTMARKLMAGWATLMAVFVLIPLAATSLPPVSAVVTVAGIGILVLIVLYVAFFAKLRLGAAQ